MQTHLDSAHRQQEILKNNNSLSDLLAILIIGGIGMTISFSAGDNLLIYGLGVIVMVLAIVKLSLDCLNAYRDYKDRTKKKDQ